MNKEKGFLGERLAEKFLISKGYSIITKNLKLGKIGEVDILCFKNKTLNLVEVKSLFNQNRFSPEIHFNSRKGKKLEILANLLLKKYPQFENCLISLVCLSFNNGKVKIKYYENVNF